MAARREAGRYILKTQTLVSSFGDDYATIKYALGHRYNGPRHEGGRSTNAIALEAQANVYVTGTTLVGKFPTLDPATIKYDTTGNQLWVAYYTGPDNSTDYAHAIAVDADGTVHVTGESAGVGTGFDYATIKYSQPCATVSGNLISNCGFETSDFTNWNRSGDPSFTSVAPECRRSDNFGLCAGPDTDLGFISQTLQTVAGQSYILRFWLRNAGTPNHFQVFWDGFPIDDEVNLGDFGYRQFTFIGLQTMGASTELQFGFYSSPDFFFLDDVVVLPSP